MSIIVIIQHLILLNLLKYTTTFTFFLLFYNCACFFLYVVFVFLFFRSAVASTSRSFHKNVFYTFPYRQRPVTMKSNAIVCISEWKSPISRPTIAGRASWNDPFSHCTLKRLLYFFFVIIIFELHFEKK